MDAQTRSLVETAQAYDLAESQRLRRAVLAKEAGLNPGEFARPFPGNQVTITHNHAAPFPAAGGLNMLKKLVPYALAGLLGAGGAGALLWPRGPVTTPTPSGAAPAQVKPLDLRVKWWVEDGQVKTQVEPVR